MLFEAISAGLMFFKVTKLPTSLFMCVPTTGGELDAESALPNQFTALEMNCVNPGLFSVSGNMYSYRPILMTLPCHFVS